jgi:hypothetical protein
MSQLVLLGRQFLSSNHYYGAGLWLRVIKFDTTRELDTKFAGLGWGLMGSGHIRVEPV